MMYENVDTAPFRQFIVKLHSRCNLSCRYCYVYHHVDQSWRGRPTVMATETISALAARIGEHARTYDIPELLVVLHGGEPLLAGPAVIAGTVDAIRRAVPASTRVDVTLQTNGTLLNDRFLAVFHRHGIGVGVSVDGGPTAHDRHRRFADGRPSFELVHRALRTLCRPEHRDVYAGLLCTVDLANDPVGVYEDLLAFDPPQVDMLLPLGNWVHPPPGREASVAGTPYADWLIRIFERWFSAPHRETGIRLFESVISLLVGGESRTEAIGLKAADAITVETDGALELTDALKTTAPGLGATGYSVHGNSFDELLTHPGIRAQSRQVEDLAPACRACPVVSACGGGQFSHRYGPDGGFGHPSVYCADLFRLIGHIRQRLEAELAMRRQRCGPRTVAAGA